MSNVVGSAENAEALAPRVSAPNVSHVIVGQVGSVVKGAARRHDRIAEIPSALAVHIGKIRGLRANEQMFRIHAGGRITRVANKLSCGNRTVFKKPGQPGRHPVPPVNANLTIAMTEAALPQPAVIVASDSNVRPEDIRHLGKCEHE